MYALVSKNYKTIYWLIRIQMEHQILIARPRRRRSTIYKPFKISIRIVNIFQKKPRESWNPWIIQWKKATQKIDLTRLNARNSTRALSCWKSSIFQVYTRHLYAWFHESFTEIHLCHESATICKISLRANTSFRLNTRICYLENNRWTHIHYAIGYGNGTMFHESCEIFMKLCCIGNSFERR